MRFEAGDDVIQTVAVEIGHAQLAAARVALKPGDAKTNAAVALAEKAQDEARAALEAARKEAGEASKTYEPFGPVYPRTSTGRQATNAVITQGARATSAATIRW